MTVLNDYGTARTVDVTAVDTNVTNLQTRLPAALVGGKVDAHIAPSDRIGYALDSAYQASLVAAIDAALLDAGDATDLIASIVARIGNTNVDEAALVAAIKASLFSAGSIANKLEVDGAGRVIVGTNADKSNYALATDQAVNVTKVGGTTVSGPNELKADVSGLSTLTASQVWSHASRALSEFAFPVTVGTNNDKTGYTLTQAFPINFASLGINASGHVNRVTLVDTTTANSDMRGTDNALLASAYSVAPSAATIADAVWDEAQSGHTTPGTFGSYVDASISGVSTGGVSAGDIATAVRSELNTELGRIDVAISSRSTFTGGAVASVTAPVTVGTNNDKAGYALTQAFPSNFASLGINASGHISRVTLVDTTTANSDMRGTDDALLASAYSTGPSAATIADAVWDEAQSGHTVPGTFGSFIDASISGVSTGGVSAGDIASAFRSELTAELGRIDATISSRSTFAGGAVASVTGAVGSVTSPVTVGTNNDKTGYSLSQAFPSNFASLGINSSGDVSRVSLVDVTTVNTDMRGTDNALLATNYNAPANADIAAIKAKTDNLSGDFGGVTAEAIWQHTERTLTSGEAEVVIDVEALAAELAEALTSSGLYRLTIDTFNETLQAVPGVQVQIVGVAGTSRTIGSSGQTTIDLDPGTYTLRVTAPNGYAPVADRELQIVDADVTTTIDLVSSLPIIVPPAGTCAFTVRVASQAGSNLVGIPVSARLPKGYVVTADTLNINPQTSLLTDTDGLASLILLRDQLYELVIRRPDGGIVTLPIRTPDAEQATLSQVIEI